MAKLPWFKFYTSDWLSDEALRSCSTAARGFWIDLLSLMHKSVRRGHLLVGGKPPSHEQLARMTGCPSEEVSRLLAELVDSGTATTSEDGTVSSRRMVREDQLYAIRSDAGQIGGFATAKSAANSQQKSSKQPAKPLANSQQKSSKTPSKPLTSDYDLWLLMSNVLTPEFRESSEFRKSWDEWVKYRIFKKKPISEFAARAQAKKIVEDFTSVERAIAAINHSIANDYQGLIEPSGRVSRSAGDSHKSRRKTEFEDDPITPQRLSF